MNVPFEWVFHPETGTFKNEALTERVKKAAAEENTPLQAPYYEPLPETEDAAWHFRYDGRLADIVDEHSLSALFPFVRYASRGEIRAGIPQDVGREKYIAWYAPRVK